MSESKKKHLYAVTIAAGEPKTVFVLAHSRAQAINGLASRYITAARAEAIDVLKAGVSMDNVIDAVTAHAAQEPLPLAEPAGTAAEQMEPKGDAYLDGVAARAEDEPAKAVTDGE